MSQAVSFDDLNLHPKVLLGIKKLGYETPSPVQLEGIPALLAGRDIVGQAQTGTGKTAAFALPILSQIEIKNNRPQALILAPTRELAIQVAEAFQNYAKFIPGFHVLPIYGGQDYQIQLRALKRGPHVVVGTPGRVMDHMRRHTLRLDGLKMLVLDEADEMLRMGFLEDVEWVLEQIEQEHQTALFSATMPTSIRNIAKRFLNNPVKVHIEPNVSTVAAIEQYYMLVEKRDKIEALTRYLEVAAIDGAIVFTGTKTYSVEVAERLSARGYAAAALNGDMSQRLREQVVAKFKNGQIDFIVATEVAARGLDVERVSHVINLDIPQAAESYIHRIGRTGRAGRSGVSLLFVTPREQRMLREIRTAVNNQLKLIQPPSVKEIQSTRASKFKSDILHVLENKNLASQRNTIEELCHESNHKALDVAAALAYLVHKETPQPLQEIEAKNAAPQDRKRRDSKKRYGRSSDQRSAQPAGRPSDKPKRNRDRDRKKPGGKSQRRDRY